MDNKTIDSLLDSMVALVGDARGSLFGQDKCMVDRDQLLYLVDALQNQIPKEIAQAKAIIEGANEIRTSARKDAAETRKNADKILKDAEERAAKLIEETTIVTFAKRREQEILEAAEEQRSMLISGAVAYADSIMEDAEKTVQDVYDTLNVGMEALQKKAKEDKAESMAKLKEARRALKNAAKSEQKEK